MKYKLKNEDIETYNEIEKITFPKYTSQLINLANQNAQGTRPIVVGQLSELFPEFLNSTDDISIKKWEEWYSDKYPNAIENATDKIYSQIQNLKNAIHLIDKEMIEQWVKDLVITKTYNGLYLQKAILASLAKKLNTSYRLATPKEESKGIDGYVGNISYSIKPDTYKTMNQLSENINVKMIFYSKTKTDLKIDVED